jgi:hypothetical protein
LGRTSHTHNASLENRSACRPGAGLVTANDWQQIQGRHCNYRRPVTPPCRRIRVHRGNVLAAGWFHPLDRRYRTIKAVEGLVVSLSCQLATPRYIARTCLSRRGGRVAEGARLESVYTGNRIVGSNPTPSANESVVEPDASGWIKSESNRRGTANPRRPRVRCPSKQPSADSAQRAT